MKKLFRVRFFGSQSDNLEIEIQNRENWPDFFSIIVALAFAFSGAVAEVQQPGKVPRIGFLDSKHCFR